MDRSWIDRLVGADSRLFRPALIWVPLTWAGAALAEVLPRWIDGSLAVGSFDRFALSDPAYLVAPLVAYGYLCRVARSAFDRFEPALEAPDPSARLRLSSTSNLAATTGFLLGGAIGVIAYHTDPSYSEILGSSWATRAVFSLLSFISVGMSVVLAWLVVRQLRQVTTLHGRVATIDLYQPEPLHAFASLTARTGTLVLLPALYSILTDPTTFDSPVWGGITVAAVGLAGTAFFGPLAGLGRRLRAEKQRMRDAAGGRLGRLTAELHTVIEERRLDAVGPLQAAIAATSDEQSRIKATSAWPWEASTIRGFTTTLLVPVLLWLVTSLLGEALGL